MSAPRSRQRRDNKSDSTQTTLAVFDERMEGLAIGLEKVLHILEGNGNPGLVDRVVELETSSVQRGKDLSNLIDSTTRISDQLSTLVVAVAEHHRPDNPQHKTFSVFLNRSPAELIKWVGYGIVVAYILTSSGALERLAKLMLGTP